MAIIKENHVVTKRNILNEMRANNMTLQELRFFSIYLSKINPEDINTRLVRFPLDDFRAIMELGRVNIDYMKNVTNGLLSKVINVPIAETGGYDAFQLFKRCKISTDANSEWYIEIDAHDDALLLMFDFKNRYFSYQLWNALRLKSSNQLRIYEILKQYEKIGVRILSIDELRNLLGISKIEYKAYKDFRIRVLDACQEALKENTDIKFTYEPYGKKGKGGKIIFLKFTIEKNSKFKDKITLDKFIKQNQNVEKKDEELGLFEEKLLFLGDACNNEFTHFEMMVIFDLLRDKVQYLLHDDLMCFDYLSDRYNTMNRQDERKRKENSKIQDRFSYFKKLIGTE